MTMIPVNEFTAEEAIDRAVMQSVQRKPEVSKEGIINSWAIAGGRGSILPPRGTRERLEALRTWYFMPEQTMMQSGFTGTAKKIGNLPWEITGDGTPNEVFTGMGQELGYSNTNTGVEFFQEVFRHANFGEGWGPFLTQAILDVFRYDTGAFIEVIGAGESWTPLTGAISGIAHLDPLRCIPTGDPLFPCIYYDRWGGLHVMHFTRVIMLQDMNDGDELRPGWGLSAESRFIAVAARELWINRYVIAYLDDEPTPGLDIIGGIIKGEFERVETQFKQQQSMDTKPVWGKRMRYYTADPAIMPKIESVQFQTAPEKFNLRDYTDISIDLLAMSLGVDRQDLAQLMGGGAIGSEAQSIILHLKSKNNTIGYLITEFERRFNDLLPDGYTFGFKYRDEQEAKQEAEKANLWGDFINKVKDILTIEQQQMLIASNVEAVHEAISSAPRVNDVDIAPERTPVTAGDDTAGAETVGSETPAEMPIPNAKAKSYAVTQGAFLQDLRTLVKQAIEHDTAVGRYSFGIRMRAMLKRYGEAAYKDGLAQGGVFVDELDSDDEADYRRVVVDQSGYISSFSDDLYVKKAITMNNLDSRVNLWGKSLQAFVDSGQVAANANGMFEWQYGMTEHCPDCLRLNGQIHRMKSWYASGWLPRASTLSCKGFNCACTLVKTNLKARGRF